MIESLNHYKLGSTSEKQNIVYVGKQVCEEIIRVDAIDPIMAVDGDVVGYVHALPDDAGEYANDTIADGIHIICDGVMCEVGSSWYQDDGLAVAPIYRVVLDDSLLTD